MASRPSDFEAQLERLLDKEKTARVNNDHPVSVLILKDIVPPSKYRSPFAIKPRSGNVSTNRLLSL